MQLFSILFFFVITICLGYSVSFFVKKPANSLENLLMNIGFGLGAFAVLSVLLNLLRIQLHWLVFLSLSLIIPLVMLYRHISKQNTPYENTVKNFFKNFKLTKSTLYILFALLIFGVFFFVYHQGAFTYPYLEDDDPWFHARVAKYISHYKTFSHDPSIQLGYIEPYPPAYAVLMGVLHQTNSNIIWSLKFFNVLLISLGLIFFYFFSNEFFQDRKKALLSTLLLALIPCFLSHFIWASSLAISLFFPVFYAVEKMRDDKNWWIIAALMAAAILLSQPSNGIIFGLMFIIYWIIKAVTSKSFQPYIFLAGFAGVVLAFLVFYLPMLFKYGWKGIADGIGFGSTSLLHFTSAESGGGLLYSWEDFIVAQTVSKMDNPIGIGFFLFFLTVFSLLFCIYIIFKKPKQFFSAEIFPYLLLTLWLLFAFAGVHGNRLPIQLMPHRFWSILAIPIALISAEGFFALGRLSEKIKIPRFFICSIFLVGIIITSGYPKYVVETSYWPPGVNWSSMEELTGYMSIVSSLPENTKVFPLCSNEMKVLAFDKFAEPWDVDYMNFKKKAFDTLPAELNAWLKSRGYEYLVLDTYCVKDHGVDLSNQKLAEIGGNTTYFNYMTGNNALFLFKVV